VVKFPTGGDEVSSKPVTRFFKINKNGGFGEIPKPTVKVWMGEG